MTTTLVADLKRTLTKLLRLTILSSLTQYGDMSELYIYVLFDTLLTSSP